MPARAPQVRIQDIWSAIRVQVLPRIVRGGPEKAGEGGRQARERG